MIYANLWPCIQGLNSFTTKNRVFFNCHRPKDIINVQKKGEDTKEKDHGETVKRNRAIQNKFRSNRKAAVFDSYSLWGTPHILCNRGALMTDPEEDTGTVMMQGVE